MSNSVAQQFRQTEKPIEPTTGPVGYPQGTQGTGYAARGALGPGPSLAPYSGVGYCQQNNIDPLPYPTAYPNDAGSFNAPLSTVAPANVVMGTVWLYNKPYRQVEINTAPAAQTDCVITLDGSPLVIGEKIQIVIMGAMQAGTLTVLQGGAATGINYTAAQFQAAAGLPPGLGVVRNLITAVAVGNTITLRFPITAAAQAQFKAVAIYRDYSDWADYAANTALMTA